MKPITKIIIFLVVAFILIIGITLATRSVVAPTTEVTTPATTTVAISPSPDTSAKTYTLADVAKHKTPTDCWTAVSGSVYNLTPFIDQHPGGVENIIKICGIDGTETFTDQHGGQKKPEKELVSLKIGTLIK